MCLSVSLLTEATGKELKEHTGVRREHRAHVRVACTAATGKELKHRAQPGEESFRQLLEATGKELKRSPPRGAQKVKSRLEATGKELKLSATASLPRGSPGSGRQLGKN